MRFRKKYKILEKNISWGNFWCYFATFTALFFLQFQNRPTLLYSDQLCLRLLHKRFWLLLWNYSPIWTSKAQVLKLDYVAHSSVKFLNHTKLSNAYVNAVTIAILPTAVNTFAAWTALVMWYTCQKRAYTKIMQNLKLTMIIKVFLACHTKSEHHLQSQFANISPKEKYILYHWIQKISKIKYKIHNVLSFY